MIEQWRTSVEALRWTVRFYAEHLPLVLGLGAIGAAERALSQFWDEPGIARILLEATTWGARLILVVLVVRMAILSDPRWSREAADRRVTAFQKDRWPSLVVDVALLAVAFVLFSTPEWLAPELTGAAEATYWAVLLGAKNLTVIPLTFIWMIGIARQAVLYEPETHPVGDAGERGRLG